MQNDPGISAEEQEYVRQASALSLESVERARKEGQNSEQTIMKETMVLETSLSKLGALMAVGYGEAGSHMIIENLAKGGDFNPMVPGEKIISIFGFCDVRKFTNATEILKEGIMLFVNEIGEICHGIVDRYSGAANKNIGDAFLFVWKFDKEDQYFDKFGRLQIRENTRVN